MPYGFEVGRTYHRRNDIHNRYAGQQQGGIITPSAHPLVIIITGEEGLTHGYDDRLRPDGVFEYFGEGQVGDMQLQRGNAAIASHAANGKDLLLFRKTKDGHRFEGEMICEGYFRKPAPDRNGDMRSALVFELRQLESVQESVEQTPVAADGLDILRQNAWQAPNAALETGTATRTIYQRSRDVRDYVLARANGLCEGCGQDAPFLRPDGSPYLEPHHIRRLSDGGPDRPDFVIALCPNCHRRVHAGQDGDAYNQELLAAMKTIEPAN